MFMNQSFKVKMLSNPKTKKRLTVIVFAIAIATPFIFATYFYASSQDYRGAKYRAQHLMVSDMSNIIENALYWIPGILNHNFSYQNRSSYAHTSGLFMWHLDSLSSEIAIMYSEGSRQATTFLHLEDAFEMSCRRLDAIGGDLLGPDHEIRASLAAALEASVLLLTRLDIELLEALFGSMSTSSVPPSTVAHMDLASVDAIALELHNLMPWPP